MQVKDKIQLLIPFTPLIAVFIVLILRPYFLFPVGGDTDFHLARAQEIIQNPFWGLFWDNITYYPMGRPVWHQPLFNAVYAGLWYLAGVRFAHSFLCISQVLLTVGVASWFANREYGIFAGYFAGLFFPGHACTIHINRSHPCCLHSYTGGFNYLLHSSR
nr:hypothetical protein [Methanobacterium formicicum]